MEMSIIEFTIDSHPIPKKATEFYRDKKTGRLRGYNKQKHIKDAWAKEIFYKVRKEYPNEIIPWNGPIGAWIYLVFPFPVGWSKKKRKQSFYHWKRPDTDNILKLLKDSITASGVWKDDAQLAMLSVGKLYADEGVIRVNLYKLPEVLNCEQK